MLERLHKEQWNPKTSCSTAHTLFDYVGPIIFGTKCLLAGHGPAVYLHLSARRGCDKPSESFSTPRWHSDVFGARTIHPAGCIPQVDSRRTIGYISSPGLEQARSGALWSTNLCSVTDAMRCAMPAGAFPSRVFTQGWDFCLIPTRYLPWLRCTLTWRTYPRREEISCWVT